jgi:hypothetical protein
MAASMPVSARFAIPQFLDAARMGSPLLYRWAIAFFTLFAIVYAGTLIDARLLNGVSVWEKPAKFFLSLSLHMATLAWGLSLLPETDRTARANHAAVVLFLAAATFEMAYIMLQAARGEASHFNEATMFTQIMYRLMGLGAVVLTLTTIFLGWRILRYAPPSPIVFATGLGFIVAGALVTGVGGYLGQQGGHWVGGDQTDATGLPFLHWSTTGGDLRVPHFFALHIMQALPLLGFVCRDMAIGRARLIISAGAMVWIGLTLLTFVQAILGQPFAS